MATTTDTKVQAILDQMISRVESGETGDWTKGWSGFGSGFPTNHTTEREYQGFNVLVLLITGYEYPTQRWATYKQWQSIGGQVRKGEKGTTLAKWGFSFSCAECDAKGREPLDCHPGAIAKRGWVNTFTVFNLAQVDGVDWEPKEPTTTEAERLAQVEAFAKATGANITEVPMPSTGAPHYSPSADQIRMPRIGQFDSAAEYYGTLFHELTHWSGSAERLARTKGARFGDKEYAAEELVAEFGAVVLAARFGVAVADDRHAAYLASWLRVLRDEDPMALYRAARDGAAAAEYLVGLAA